MIIYFNWYIFQFVFQFFFRILSFNYDILGSQRGRAVAGQMGGWGEFNIQSTADLGVFNKYFYCSVLQWLILKQIIFARDI